ncbi:MAG TPA: thioredoxin domain-containing protein [Vicinamibacteria bacterium]|nr:thioredoxin domain-containing protein [Vicinamibacteria bacterium]
MTRRRPRVSATTHSDARPTPGAGALGLLVVLGAASALWSVFLWGELVRARQGGTAFCPMGGDARCFELWDGAFASAVHALTGLPLAGWGVAWGLAAFALPLALLVRLADERPSAALVSATRLAGAAAAVAVFVLLGVSATARAFCASCFLYYVLVAGYAGVALVTWRPLGLPDPRRGAALAAAAMAVAWGALLYPGLATPRSAGDAGRQALPAASPASAGTGDASRDRALVELVGSLPPQLKQTLADALHLYRRSPVLPTGPARALRGSPSAPVRITEFTDILCGHCAELQATLRDLEGRLPPGSFSVDARQFPLDAACNPAVSRSGEPVRCAAARAQVCMEGDPSGAEYTKRLFERQEGLTLEAVVSLAEGLGARGRLEACMASAETQAKISADSELAMRHGLDGTPLVLVNGRKGVSFAPFLYAMILTGGSPDHPAFASLPPPNPSAHLH